MAIKTMIVKPVAAAVGVAFVASLAFSSVVVADDNPFESTDLDTGYMMAGGDKGEEGKCGEGKCGGDEGEEGTDQEGEEDTDHEGEEGSCGGDDGDHEGEEGSCGVDDKGEEGSCGGDDKGEEGACGSDDG